VTVATDEGGDADADEDAVDEDADPDDVDDVDEDDEDDGPAPGPGRPPLVTREGLVGNLVASVIFLALQAAVARLLGLWPQIARPVVTLWLLAYLALLVTMASPRLRGRVVARLPALASFDRARSVALLVLASALTILAVTVLPGSPGGDDEADPGPAREEPAGDEDAEGDGAGTTPVDDGKDGRTTPTSEADGAPRSAAEHIAEAQELERAGGLEEDAEAAYEAAIAADPEDPAAYLGAAWRAYGDDDIPRARELVTEGLRRRPDFGDLYLLRSILAEVDGDVESAFADARRYRDLTGGVEADVRLAALESWRGDPATALELADRALAVDPTHLAARYERAVALIRTGRVDEGEAAIVALIDGSEAPEARWFNQRGRLAHSRGDDDAAVADFERAIEHDTTDWHGYWTNLGDAHRYRGDVEAARHAYEEARRRAPDDRLVRVGEAWLALDEDRPRDAVELAEGLIDEVGEDEVWADLSELYATALLADDRADDARAWALDALRDVDRWAGMRLLLGRAHLALDEPGPALLAARQAAEDSPSWYRPWYDIAGMEADAGRPAAAIEAARRGVAEADGSEEVATTQWRLGWSYYDAGRVDEAVTALEAAVAARPDSAFYLSELAWIGYDEQGDADRAIDALSDAAVLARSQDDPIQEAVAHYRRAWVRWNREDDGPLALADAERAVEVAGTAGAAGTATTTSALGLQAEIHLAAGRLVDAAEAHEAAIALGLTVAPRRGLALMLVGQDCLPAALAQIEALADEDPDEWWSERAVARALDEGTEERTELLESALATIVRLLAAEPGPDAGLTTERADTLADLDRLQEAYDVLADLPADAHTAGSRLEQARRAYELSRPLAETVELVRTSLALDGPVTDPWTHAYLSWLLRQAGDQAGALAEAEVAVALDPELAFARQVLAEARGETPPPEAVDEPTPPVDRDEFRRRYCVEDTTTTTTEDEGTTPADDAPVADDDGGSAGPAIVLGVGALLALVAALAARRRQRSGPPPDDDAP
jgi:tetratricopeptide (TPR) repeat protein